MRWTRWAPLANLGLVIKQYPGWKWRMLVGGHGWAIVLVRRQS